MRTVSIRLEDLAKMTVKIGFVGENEHTRVCIDCKKAFDEYPGAVATLTVQPPAGEAYPDVTTRDGDTVIWDVEDHDLTDEGEGEFQLSFVVDETVMKSYIGRTAICRSIVPTGDVPAAIDDWLTRANAALAEIPVEIAAALEEAKESGEFDGRGISDAVLNDDYTLTLYFTDDTSYTTPSIKGGPGEPGFSPTITITEITGGHRLTITDVEGTQTVDILDGEKGDTGNGIAYCVLNQDYTLTITYTDGRRYTTQSIRGAQGEQGEPGATGETGATPVISIGTVSTLTPGSDATASMDTTDPEHPVLSLGIPEGEPGEVTEAELQAVAESKADLITESITTPAAVQTIQDGGNGFPMEIVVGLEPVQDTHGYDYPWPAGGGKNLFNKDSYTSISGYFSRTDIVSNAAHTIIYFPCSVGVSYTASRKRTVGNERFGIAYTKELPANGVLIYDSHAPSNSGTVGEVMSCTTTTGEDAQYVVVWAWWTTSDVTEAKNTLQIEIGSSASTYTPYENICPISGHTGVEPVVTGENLLDKTFFEENGIDSSGANQVSAFEIRLKNLFSVFAGKTYTFSYSGTAAYCYVYYYKNEVFDSRVSLWSNGSGHGTFTVPSGINGIRFKLGNGATPRPSVDANFMFEYGSSVSIYEAYTGTSYPITFPTPPGTVYGCTFRFKKDGTGVLTVNRVHKIITEVFAVSSSRAVSYVGELNSAVNNENTRVSNMLKSVAQGTSVSTIPNGEFTIYNSTAYGCACAAFKMKGVSGTIEAYNAKLDELNNAGTPLEVCYELATPVTYNLTAEECAMIRSLYGTNNLWLKNAGQTINSVDYAADTKLYISKELDASRKLMELIITANREDEMKATKAYSTGNLMIVNGTLYKATTSIANGATLTAGTNVTATTVAAEIAAIS